MIERPVAAGLLALPILYTTALLLPVFPAWAIGVPFALAVSLGIAALTSRPSTSARDLGAWVGIALSLFFALTVWEPTTFGDTPATLAVGVLLGLPWIAWVYVWRAGETLGNRLFAYVLALTVSLILLATLSNVHAGATPVTPDSFVAGFYSVNSLELQGIVTVLTQAGRAALPLHDLFDPVFAALVGVSTLGLVLLVLRPRTGDERPLPITFAVRWEEPAHRELSTALGFSESQRAVFHARSLPEPPASAVPPGLAAVLFAAIATGAFLGFSFLLPYWALLAGTLAVAGMAALLVSTTDIRYRPDVGPGPAAGSTAAAPPTPPVGATAAAVPVTPALPPTPGASPEA